MKNANNTQYKVNNTVGNNLERENTIIANCREVSNEDVEWLAVDMTWPSECVLIERTEYDDVHTDFGFIQDL